MGETVYHDPIVFPQLCDGFFCFLSELNELTILFTQIQQETVQKQKKYHHIHVNKRHTKAEVIFQVISDYQVHNVSKKQEDKQMY